MNMLSQRMILNRKNNGVYNVNVNIPKLTIEKDSAKKINDDIESIFVEKLKQLAKRNK